MCDVNYRDAERKVFQRVRLGMKLTGGCNYGFAYQLQEEEEQLSHQKQVCKVEHFINCVLQISSITIRSPEDSSNHNNYNNSNTNPVRNLIG